MSSIETFRFIVICIGGITWAAAAGSIGYYWRRDAYMTLRGIGSLIGLTYVEADLIARLHDLQLTFREPLALVCFIVILYAITGTYAKEDHL